MIIGESQGEKRNREAQKDDARRASAHWSELTGEPLEYLDIFTYDPRPLARIHWTLGRRPKCLEKK